MVLRGQVLPLDVQTSVTPKGLLESVRYVGPGCPSKWRSAPLRLSSQGAVLEGALCDPSDRALLVERGAHASPSE